MQRAHKFGSFNIRRILLAENPPLLADDEAKILNMVRQVLETKAQRLVRRDIEIVIRNFGSRTKECSAEARGP